MRQVLSTAEGSDQAILIPWVDRIHKDALHTSLFSYYNRFIFTINVVAGTASYAISTGSNPGVRRILSVYDRTFDRVLLPYESLGQPSNKSDAEPAQPAQVPNAMLSATTMEQWPEYYQRVFGAGAGNIVLYPAPQKTVFDGTYEVTYEGNVATLTTLTSALIIPDDGLDLVVAGVNGLAAAYLKNPEDSAFWKAQYQEMKQGAFVG
ncbi:unnamed protein product [Sphagnum jensenii]